MSGFPFSAVVGQERLKLALLLNAVNPATGGVLVRGEKGTAKSTTVRGLTAILPGGGARVVTLPLNATEDRVAGGIDFTATLRTGSRRFQPGLLADAHGGILYVDEVNLLDDHIVDLILDAAVSGRNVIEREGLSHEHESRFILVGTMNPEEGELRPQLTDRFGLCVDVCAERDVQRRVLLMERREEYDQDSEAFVARFHEDEERLAARIVAARDLLPEVRLPAGLREMICEICTVNNVAGHRADLVMEQATRSLAALEGRIIVTTDDVSEVAPLVLAHRSREASPPESGKTRDETPEHTQEGDHREQENTGDDGRRDEEAGGRGDAPDGESGEVEPRDSGEDGDVREEIFRIGETFGVRRIAVDKDRVLRRGSGRRSTSLMARNEGRYVRSTMSGDRTDLALDATLRAAAPHQRERENVTGLAVVLRPQDLRGKVREKRVANFLLFVVDASGSMGARSRMSAAKGAIMSLLLDAYQKRDRVAMVSFRRREAVLNLPPTGSVDLAARLLEELPVGGRTPLPAGLRKAGDVLGTYLRREPTARPIVTLITDGRANASLGGGDPRAEALELAGQLGRDERVRYIVVDTEQDGLISLGLAGGLARAMNAEYFRVEDLRSDTLVKIAKGNEG